MDLMIDPKPSSKANVLYVMHKFNGMPISLPGYDLKDLRGKALHLKISSQKCYLGALSLR